MKDVRVGFGSICRSASVPFLVLVMLSGCTKQGYSVIASTGTLIGVEISQSPTSQAPQAKLGYNRAELAFVPSNRSGGEAAGNTFQGARDTANVLMELRYDGIFDLGEGSGIYQRLAVGDIAVKQDGAAAMFLKNASGNIDPDAVRALEAIRGIKAPDFTITSSKAPISAKFLEIERSRDKGALEKFESAAKELGYPKTLKSYPDYPAFRDFITSPHSTPDEVAKFRQSLQGSGITF